MHSICQYGPWPGPGIGVSHARNACKLDDWCASNLSVDLPGLLLWRSIVVLQISPWIYWVYFFNEVLLAADMPAARELIMEMYVTDTRLRQHPKD